MAAIAVQIQGDEWWLKPEQHPSETRDEWKARTFSLHFGRHGLFVPSDLWSVSPEETEAAIEKFRVAFPELIKLIEKDKRDGTQDR